MPAAIADYAITPLIVSWHYHYATATPEIRRRHFAIRWPDTQLSLLIDTTLIRQLIRRLFHYNIIAAFIIDATYAFQLPFHFAIIATLPLSRHCHTSFTMLAIISCHYAFDIRYMPLRCCHTLLTLMPSRLIDTTHEYRVDYCCRCLICHYQSHE